MDRRRSSRNVKSVSYVEKETDDETEDTSVKQETEKDDHDSDFLSDEPGKSVEPVKKEKKSNTKAVKETRTSKSKKPTKRRSSPLSDSNSEEVESKPKRARSSKKVVKTAGDEKAQGSRASTPPSSSSSVLGRISPIILESLPEKSTIRRGNGERSSHEECEWFLEFSKTLWSRIELYQDLPAILAIVKAARGTDGGKLREVPGDLKEQENENSSDSEDDEWEEMEPVDAEDQDEKKAPIQVTLKPKKNSKVDDMDMMIAKYLRTEVNRGIREYTEQFHEMHILCHLAHLNRWTKAVKDDEGLLASTMLSLIPSGYTSTSPQSINVEVVTKLVSWFRSAFQVRTATSPIRPPSTFRDKLTGRLAVLIDEKAYEDDKERAILFFLCLLSLGLRARILMNSNILSKDPGEILKLKEGKELKQKKKFSKKEFRNYWTEYWSESELRWICVDPLHGTVDTPEKIVEDAMTPIFYVFAIDSDFGIRELALKYSPISLTQEFHKERVDPEWLKETLACQSWNANRTRARAEDVEIQSLLMNRPMPTKVTEFKSHPLYALEKDLLKFEAIYPKDVKTLGEIRGHKIYPRSAVHTLQGELNWIKEARSVKEGEEPYKVVKARPKINIPAEEREPLTLKVYGFWQTEPYRPGVVANGRIPRNEHGNVYMYQPNMVPKGCVHLRLPGLVSIGRRIDADCVPAITGWEFHKGGNHPIVDGCVILAKDAPRFRREYAKLEKERVIKEEKKREERVFGNWRRLIRGILRLHFVRTRFGRITEDTEQDENTPSTSDGKSSRGKKKIVAKKTKSKDEKEVEEELKAAWPATNFKLPAIGDDLDLDM